ELSFEDEKGQEELFLHAEKDLNHIVKHDETTQIGKDRTEQVARDEAVNIGNNRTEMVVQDEDLTINRDQTNRIGRNRITKIEKDDILNINNSRYIDVHGDTIINVGKELNIEIAQNGTWYAGEVFEQICDIFDLEGYEQVELSGPGGSIIINREPINQRINRKRRTNRRRKIRRKVLLQRKRRKLYKTGRRKERAKSSDARAQ
ncbi:bacteriophage T4 gp5 trimerisation domain-containing protein, partial [Rodentibacter ratti]|uniref:bacteriophage T4 gp5 trimerisation domain-containing protein n=1 Tax=Rodentibacter ratti TaxID=1906745 RepID=UPI003F895CD2